MIENTVAREMYFGDIRVSFHGSFSGSAGLNLNLGAKVELNVDKNLLLAGGVIATAAGGGTNISGSASSSIDQPVAYTKEKTHIGNVASGKTANTLAEYNAELSAKAAAFAGAKAEAGIKAAIDWRAPAEESTTDCDGYSCIPPKIEVRQFVTLGDVGFALTGMAGVGFNGEFKVGFDEKSRRFQIKLKANLAIGLGGGGSISFSVSAEHMFNFVQVVHRQLSDNNFHFLDVFEDHGTNGLSLDVYGLFCAWSYEMAKNGHLIEAGVTYLSGVVLEGAVELLQGYTAVLESWQRGSVESENLDKLIHVINADTAQLRFYTPETKGRLLYRLYKAKADRYSDSWWGHQMLEMKRMFTGDFGRVWDDNFKHADWHHDIEEAALLLIERGVISGRDWQKTLENMATINSTGQLVPVCNAPDTIGKKLDCAMDNLERINQLFSDPEDNQRLQKHLSTIQAISPAHP